MDSVTKNIESVSVELSQQFLESDLLITDFGAFSVLILQLGCLLFKFGDKRGGPLHRPPG